MHLTALPAARYQRVFNSECQTRRNRHALRLHQHALDARAARPPCFNHATSVSPACVPQATT